MLWKFFLTFSSKSFIFLALMFRSFIHFELIFIYDLRVQLHSFAGDYPVFPAVFVEKTFSVEWSWHPCKKSFDYIFKSLFLSSLFCTAIVLCQYHIVLFTVALLWSQEVRVFFKIVRFHMNFRSFFPLQNMLLRYLWGLHWINRLSSIVILIILRLPILRCQRSSK